MMLSDLRRRPFTAILCTLCVVIAARPVAAAKLDVLLVDPAHSDTGDLVAATLKSIPGASLDRVDIPALRTARLDGRSAVVWVGPEPSLYSGKDSALWGALVGTKEIGLLVIGL